MKKKGLAVMPTLFGYNPNEADYFMNTILMVFVLEPAVILTR